MKTFKHDNTRHGIVTSVALIAALFAGTASAMADPESHRDADARAGEARRDAGVRVIEGRVGPILVIDAAERRAAELDGRPIQGPVGRVIDRRAE